MPTFNNLLGFKDMAEALYAEAATYDEVRKMFPSYGNAQQGKNAQFEEAISKLGAVSTVSGLVVDPPDALEFTANSSGVLDPGQLPVTVSYVVTLFAMDMLGDPRTEVIFTPVGLAGSELSQGVFEITAVTAEAAYLDAKINFGGVEQGNWRTPVKIVKAAAPPPVVVVPPATATPAASFELAAVSSTSYQNIGQANFNGGFSYDVAVASSFASPTARAAASNIEAYLAYRSSGSTGAWTIFAGPVLAYPTTVTADDVEPAEQYFIRRTTTAQYFVEPGYLNLTGTAVLPSGLHTIAVFAQLAYGEPVNVLSPAVVQPS